MIRRRCAGLSGSTSAASRRPTKPRCAAFAICSKPTISAAGCLTRCSAISPKTGSRWPTGTIVDATIISAPSSTKNRDKARDPEMHQTKKGNQWYFGMKAHVGVDSRTKLIHAVVATAANVADRRVLPRLLHGRETRVRGDQAYRGQCAVIRQHAPNAKDFTNRRYRQRGVADLVERAKNRTKSKARTQVEHSIGVVKRVFGFAKRRNPPAPRRKSRADRLIHRKTVAPWHPARRPAQMSTPTSPIDPLFTRSLGLFPGHRLFPFVRVVRRHQAMPPLECLAERRLTLDVLCLGIDIRLLESDRMRSTVLHGEAQ